MTDTTMVSVPRDLLATVLDEAERNSHTVQGDRNCNSAADAESRAERNRIDGLRKIAGITSAGVVGEGFFGVASALKDQQDKSNR